MAIKEPIPQAPGPVSDTELDRQRMRRPKGGQGGELKTFDAEPSQVADGPAVPVALLRGDPGDTKKKARLTAVQVREAIVRRNAEIDAQLSNPRLMHKSQKGLTMAKVDWARCLDSSQKVVVVGHDGVRAQFIASGEVAGSPQTKAQNPMPSLAIGLDGVIYSVPVFEGEDPQTTLSRLAARLDEDFETELHEEGELSCFLRLLKPRKIQ